MPTAEILEVRRRPGAGRPVRLALSLALGLVAASPHVGRSQPSEFPHRVTDGWADLRSQAVLEAREESRSRGRALLARVAERHGLAAWRRYRTLTVVAHDEWAEPGSWWPTASQAFRLDQLNGTFTSRAELLDGPAQGEIWGVQSWRGYKIMPPAAGALFASERDGALLFYLPSLHYFNELPFRLLAAPTVVDAGEGRLGNRTYDLVFVSWDEAGPSGEHDQYVLWIGRDSGLVEKAHYTVREAAALASPEQREMMKAGAVGTIHYEDYRDVGGVALPFRQTVTLFGPEQAVEPLAESFFHRILVSEARWDVVSPAALVPDPALPAPADRKPAAVAEPEDDPEASFLAFTRRPLAFPGVPASASRVIAAQRFAADRPDALLDLYLPRQAAGPAPVVLLVHGGIGEDLAAGRLTSVRAGGGHPGRGGTGARRAAEAVEGARDGRTPGATVRGGSAVPAVPGTRSSRPPRCVWGCLVTPT